MTTTARRAGLLGAVAVLLLLAYLLGGGRQAAAAPAVVLAPSAGSTTAAQNGITVSATGSVSGTPDTLRLDLTVTHTADTVDAALAGANGAASAVQKSLSGHGILGKDQQTSGLSLTQHYTNSGKPGGYDAAESLTVRLRDLTTAGATITAAVHAGGDAVRVDGLSLSLEDDDALVASARSQAFDHAKAKAGQYAQAAGRSLGAVVSIDETVQQPGPTPYPYAYAAARSADIPVQAGSQQVQVTVTVVFAFG